MTAADITPSQIAAAQFRTVRKGYDPDQVDEFLAQVAKALEQAQQHSTAMEARARAAVSRLQEVTSAQQVGETTSPAPEPAREPSRPGEIHAAPDEVETISRTLLLAQRTADTTIAEAQAEAERITAEAQQEAEATLDSTREMSARLLDEAKTEARKLSESEREAAANEVEALRARREFLVGDVDQLEQFLIDQRERLRGAARQIEALCERVPSGLGTVRPPALSAADDESDQAATGTDAAEHHTGEIDADEPTDDGTDAEFERLAARAVDGDWDGATDETAELVVPPEAAGPFAGIDELVEALEDGDDDALGSPPDLADPGPNVGPGQAPQLPKRNSPPD